MTITRLYRTNIWVPNYDTNQPAYTELTLPGPEVFVITEFQCIYISVENAKISVICCQNAHLFFVHFFQRSES